MHFEVRSAEGTCSNRHQVLSAFVCVCGSMLVLWETSRSWPPGHPAGTDLHARESADLRSEWQPMNQGLLLFVGKGITGL